MSKKKTKKIPLWVWIAGGAVLVLAVVLCVVLLSGGNGSGTGESTGATTKIDNVQEVTIDLGYGMTVTDIGSYTGAYVEDGSNEVVSGVLMAVVTNNGTQTVQYAQFQLTDGENTAAFSLSTLPPGESVVVLAQKRMAYTAGMTQATVQNVALFQAEPTLCQDKIKIQALDGALNITNISGEDITGIVVVYYKNSSADMLYGGITYRVVISGGMKAGEIRQLTAAHFSTFGSRIMFVTCG